MHRLHACSLTWVYGVIQRHLRSNIWVKQQCRLPSLVCCPISTIWLCSNSRSHCWYLATATADQDPADHEQLTLQV